MRVSVSPKLILLVCFSFTGAFREMILEADLLLGMAVPTSPAARFFKIPDGNTHHGNRVHLGRIPRPGLALALALLISSWVFSSLVLVTLGSCSFTLTTTSSCLPSLPNTPFTSCFISSVSTFNLKIFDKMFDTEPHWQLVKELFTQAFGTPKYHPKSQPFIGKLQIFEILSLKIF